MRWSRAPDSWPFRADCGVVVYAVRNLRLNWERALSRVTYESDSTRLNDATVVAELHCRGCGYDLRGLPVNGRCPECGLELWETIVSTVDPATSRLPRLGNAKAVGNGLLCLIACLLIGVMLLTIEAVFGGLAHLWQTMTWRLGVLTLPRDVPLLVACSGVLSIWGLVRLWPVRQPARSERLRRDLWLITGGIIGWIIASAALWLARTQMVPGTSQSAKQLAVLSAALLQLAIAGAAAAALGGLSGVLREIGLRSRVYRRARGGRQRIQPMLGAVAGVMVGLILRMLGSTIDTLNSLTGLGEVLIAVSLLMLVVGQVYLLINAWWIRAAIRRPPPPLSELIAVGDQQPAST